MQAPDSITRATQRCPPDIT